MRLLSRIKDWLIIPALIVMPGLHAQLHVTEVSNAAQLAQRLVGDGVIISNASMVTSRNIIPTGFFVNDGGTNINIDSGIVMTSGRAKTDYAINRYGVDGNGSFTALSRRADNNLQLGGDPTLAAELGIPVTDLYDAISLEFDFIPLGDSIKFNYVLSSEEYTTGTVCVFNDAFGFFISGPGITGVKNIALIPGTNTPVTITNVNNIVPAGCVSHPELYIDNNANIFTVHEGNTRVLTALSQVMPCQTYHLKLVIADRGDHLWDTGVFLQARSLTSNAIGMTNLTQTDQSGNSYLVEGCATGAFNVRRPHKDPLPLTVNLSYSGTAVNGTDYFNLPAFVTIPANDSFVTVQVIPVIDNVAEGIETLKVYALAGCTTLTPTDSTIIQIRDYDTLRLNPGNSGICRLSSIQLQASGSYSSYQWDVNPTLNNLSIRNPIATPVSHLSQYYCTAVEGDCHARDSITLTWKDLEFISKQDVFCKNGNNGQLKLAAGNEWRRPVEFSIDNISWQPDSVFNNLPVGNYRARVRDGICEDSIYISIIQAFPDLVINSLDVHDATCSGLPDGEIVIQNSGGRPGYVYSSDGVSWQPSSILRLMPGSYTCYVKDANGCSESQSTTIARFNSVTLEAGSDTSICEGRSYLIPTVSNASTISWSPSTSLNNAAILQPRATPVVDTKYFVLATTGVCTRLDSVTVKVWPAPVANAGPPLQSCFGKIVQLHGEGGTVFHWSPSLYMTTSSEIQEPKLKAKNNITYSLMVKDARGCESLTPSLVDLSVTPSVKIFAGNDTVAAMGQPLQLQVKELSRAGVVAYTWTSSNFLNDPHSSSPVATLNNDYSYVVTGITADGCEATDDIHIKVYKGPEIYVPSGFTPDHNGLNDVLKAIPVGIKQFAVFRIFDRWGQVIFETRDPKKGWDGKINGVEQTTGMYVWTAEATDYKGNLINRKGVVTIIR